MAYDSDEFEAEATKLSKAKSTGSKEGDGNDSDGGKSVKGPGRLSKLLKRNKKSKILKGDGSTTLPDDDSQDIALQRGRSRSPYLENASTASLGLPATRGDGSSVMTSDDEDEAEAHRSPPPLVNHPSHRDYLVATSSRISASTTTTITGGSASHSKALSHVSTLPSDNFDFDSRAVPGVQHAWTMTGKLGVENQARSQSRSVSPGARFKDAFKVSSRKTSPSKEGGEERQRPGTREGEQRPQSQPVSHRPGTRGSTTSLPLSVASNGTDSSIPPVPPIPSSPPQISINGAGLASKPSLNSIVLSSGDPGRTPALTATPPTPINPTDDSAPRTPPFRSATKPSSPGPTLSGHRRSRSDSASKQPSKLSQSMTSPLTPTQEEPPQSRGRNISQGSAGSGGGFFSSVFNAAQNMTSTITNMGGGTNRPRGTTTGSGTGSIPEEKEEAEVETTHQTGEKADSETEVPKPLAIDTMGTGNLSLTHLGITTESPQALNAPNSSMRSRSGTQVRHEEHSAKMEDASAAEAISAAYSAPLPVNGIDRPATAVAEDTSLGLDRPPSQSGSLIARTPPNGSIYDGDSGLRRTGSIRDKLADRRRKKHRNSSGATIGAAIAASQTALASPTRNSVTAKLEGFTYANRKRDKDHHNMFRSVPEDDHLLDDFSCALQRDIILAGRIYVSEGHICFSSNILGWVTNLIISFDEIVAIDKESTAMVFPNAIAIQTLHARHTFRSLLSREATYDLMISVWKTNHPNLQSTETGTKLLSGADAIAAENEARDSGDDEDDDEDSDEDSDDDETQSLQSHPASASPSDVGGAAPVSPSRKASQAIQDATTAAPAAPTVGEGKAAAGAATAAATADKDFPGPATHGPTECADAAQHYEHVLTNEIIPAPLGKVYSMVFGPASGVFMTRWLADEAKCWDIEGEGGGPIKAIDNDNKSRTVTYMKPLPGPIGPRQTKCIVKEEIDAFDLEKAVSVSCSTQTPDVPSGNIFATKTRFCFSWAPGNATKFHMSFFTEWSGKSWIKGPIEKGSKDGQGQFAEELVKALKAGVSTGSRARAGSKGKKGKKGKKGDNQSGSSPGPVEAKGKQKKTEDWGLLDPLRPILGPVVDPIKPLFSARSICVLLLFLLTISWFRNSRLRVKNNVPSTSYQLNGPAGYDHLWRNEEEALWKWLEERVAMKDGIPIVSGDKTNADKSKAARKQKQQVLRGRGLLDSMSVREIEYALQVTKNKLGQLERAVGIHTQQLDGDGRAGSGSQTSHV